MKQVLVYSDSLTWGIVPNSRRRLPFEERWPGVLECTLNNSGPQVRVIEDCLNGRRTVWDDPFKPGRNGLNGLQQRIEICSPLALVILMLGNNDFQFCHPYNDAWAVAQGIVALVNEIRSSPVEPGMLIPPILIVCPPRIQVATGAMAPKFRGAAARSSGTAEACEEVASSLRCHFFDANTVTGTSKVDGVHLDSDQHQILGDAIATVVRPILFADQELP